MLKTPQPIVRAIMPTGNPHLDSVSLDFIIYLMSEFAERYCCTELVYNIYRRSEGMDLVEVAKIDASSRRNFPMGDYTYTYKHLDVFADAAIQPYLLDGAFPNSGQAVFHDPAGIAWGMVLDAKEYEFIVGLTVVGPQDQGYLVCGCLAQLLLFVVNSAVKRQNQSLPKSRDEAILKQLSISAGNIWAHLIETQSIQAIEAFSYVNDLINSNFPPIRDLRDILTSK